MLSERCALAPSSSYPFQVLATRYYVETSDAIIGGFTLVLLHAVGMHKETWEVTIERLFKLSNSSGNKVPVIRDIFSIESPNHGESAVLNEATIYKHYPNSCTSC
jgi:hypothetical protein